MSEEWKKKEKKRKIYAESLTSVGPGSNGFPKTFVYLAGASVVYGI